MDPMSTDNFEWIFFNVRFSTDIIRRKVTYSIIDRQLLNSVFVARISGDLVEKTIFDDLKRNNKKLIEIRSNRKDLNYEKLNVSFPGIKMNCNEEFKAYICIACI